jgi:hypothetical protein
MQLPSGVFLVTMSEIATMAKVKRPVVSTWRRRHADFPVPVAENVGGPLFHGQEVVEWLIATGLGNADPAQLSAELALHSIVAHADRFGPRHLIEIVGSLLCLRHLDDKPLLPDGVSDTPASAGEVWGALLHRAERMDPEDEFVLRELRAADSSAVVLARLAENLIEAAYTARGAFEWLLASRTHLGLIADALVSELRQLLVELADLRPRIEQRGHITVADPHAHDGDLLAALVRAVDDPAQTGALAAEPESWLARVARRRLLIGGVNEVDLDVQTGTDLEERLANPDLVVTQLPYQAGETRSKLAALEGIEKIGDLLGPGCTALILGPADALVGALPGGDEARLRAALLRSGLLEAVVNLPGGVTPYRPGYRCALWVLTRDPVKAARGYVLLADISSEPLSERVRTRLAQDVLLWRAEGRCFDGHDPRHGRIVSIARLDEQFGGSLIPPGLPVSQLLARTVTERPALIAEAEGRLKLAGEQTQRHAEEHGHLRGNIIRRDGERPTPTTLGALIAARRVAKVKGHRLDPQHFLPEGHHKVLGPEEVCGSSPVGARRIDRAVLAAVYEHAAFTEPGDIVFTTSPHVSLMLDHDGFSVVVFPARVLRVNPDAERPLTSRVLAALLGAARNTGRSPSAVRAARRIEDFALPDLDPTDIERLDALLADIERRQELLRSQDEALAEVRRLTVAGFADGTLTIDRP